ncbi:hypothetical protein TNCV_4365171 [Trichonephila clavipes]|nr:hypothetical protein TNCV_4365171 [Trichonephila clavipes]
MFMHAYSSDTLSRTQAFEGHRHFNEYIESVQYGECSGCRQTSSTAENNANVSAEVVSTHHSPHVKRMPKFCSNGSSGRLHLDSRQRYFPAYQIFFWGQKRYLCYPSNSREHQQCGNTQHLYSSRNSTQDHSKGIFILEVFFDIKGILNLELISEEHIVTKIYILRRLRELIRKKRPKLWAE